MQFKTSGSTGEPKIIDLSESDMVKSAMSTIHFFGLTKDSVLASPLSTQYIAGAMMEYRARVLGCRLLVDTPSNNPFVNYCFGDVNRIDLMCLVPSQVPSFLDNAKLLSMTRNVIVGGAPLDCDTELRLQASGVNAYITYGMTETASHVALRRAGTAFYRALPGISFETDADSRLIIVAAERSFGRLLTNDIVYLHSPLEFVWKGRFDNVVNSGGVKLFPEELESRMAHLFQFPFYFIGRPSDKWGSELHMVVEAEEGSINREEIFSRLRAVLNRMEMPKAIIFKTALEYTSSGKVKRI